MTFINKILITKFKKCTREEVYYLNIYKLSQKLGIKRDSNTV